MKAHVLLGQIVNCFRLNCCWVGGDIIFAINCFSLLWNILRASQKPSPLYFGWETLLGILYGPRINPLFRLLLSRQCRVASQYFDHRYKTAQILIRIADEECRTFLQSCLTIAIMVDYGQTGHPSCWNRIVKFSTVSVITTSIAGRILRDF